MIEQATTNEIVSELMVRPVSEFNNSILALKNEVEEGNLDGLKVYVFLKGLEKSISGILPALLESARNEAEKYGSKSFSAFGAKVELKEVGTKWYFDNTQDPVYTRLFDAAANAKKSVSDREKFLKSLSDPMFVMDEETGEQVKVFPPRKESTSGISITIL